MQLQKRLAALETKRTAKAPRLFHGYPQVNRYYEVGSSPINYRSGINNEPEAGPCFTRADLDQVIINGHAIDVLAVEYVEMNFSSHTHA